MKLIDKNITDITPGYDDILRAENELRSRWRPKLLAAYARRKEIVQHEKNIQEKRRFLTFLGFILGVIILLAGVGISCRGIVQAGENLLAYCCGGPLLALLGLLILGAAGFSRGSAGTPKPRRVPLHPLRSGPSNNGIYPDLRESWAEGLNGVLKDEVPDYPHHRDSSEKNHGAQGERIFIKRLREICSDDYYVLAGTMQRPNEDVDIILIGPKGVWVFEVKHWSGDIYWDDRGWRREQTYYERGGVEITKQPEVGEPPDEQWNRAAAEVSRTLQNRAPEVLARYPALEKVRGGIVFTHPNAVFKFQPGRPTFWGPLNFWIKALTEVEIKANLDRHSALQLVEALLARHQELDQTGTRRSLSTCAQGKVLEADEKLEAWVQA